ncbi:hypothetical protein OM169_07810 [Escherichia albertii]|nr:hypothetical protein [Escherichia albertii]
MIPNISLQHRAITMRSSYELSEQYKMNLQSSMSSLSEFISTGLYPEDGLSTSCFNYMIASIHHISYDYDGPKFSFHASLENDNKIKVSISALCGGEFRISVFNEKMNAIDFETTFCVEKMVSLMSVRNKLVILNLKQMKYDSHRMYPVGTPLHKMKAGNPVLIFPSPPLLFNVDFFFNCFDFSDIREIVDPHIKKSLGFECLKFFVEFERNSQGCIDRLTTLLSDKVFDDSRKLIDSQLDKIRSRATARGNEPSRLY